MGVGIFVSFFRPGGRSFALKSCFGGGDFDEKNSGPGVNPGGDGNRSNWYLHCHYPSFRDHRLNY